MKLIHVTERDHNSLFDGFKYISVKKNKPVKELAIFEILFWRMNREKFP